MDEYIFFIVKIQDIVIILWTVFSSSEYFLKVDDIPIVILLNPLHIKMKAINRY